ncbi:MAG: hypothetical protein HY516_02000 [Candidatus Aenigmarchaeota archaeon]|nr:hypothetical protein [Candidatus Aenigmarchaeota archaeon]
MALETILDGLSIALLIGITVGFVYTITVYFKGMEKPPFWLYLMFGFVFVASHGILQASAQFAGQLVFLSGLRLVGYLLVFVAVVQLLRSYNSKIKFDKPSGRQK